MKEKMFSFYGDIRYYENLMGIFAIFKVLIGTRRINPKKNDLQKYNMNHSFAKLSMHVIIFCWYMKKRYVYIK